MSGSEHDFSQCLPRVFDSLLYTGSSGWCGRFSGSSDGLRFSQQTNNHNNINEISFNKYTMALSDLRYLLFTH